MGGDSGGHRHKRFAVQEVHPGAHRVNPAAQPYRMHQLEHKPGQSVGVTGGIGMLDGGFGHPRSLRTSRLHANAARGPVLSRYGGGRLAASAEQVVVAVPLTATVQRNHEQVASFELLEHPGRPPAADHGVAERSAHPVENRGADEEADLRRERRASSSE